MTAYKLETYTVMGTTARRQYRGNGDASCGNTVGPVDFKAVLLRYYA